MTAYTLTYFDLRFRGETARMLFRLAGKTFTDVRLDRFGEEWPQLKPKTPLGKLPILKVGDKTLCQTHAIERYLGREFGYDGKTSMDKAVMDMVADGLEDIFRDVVPVLSAAGKDERKAAQSHFREELLAPLLGNMQDILQQNRGGDGYFVGDSLTWIDLSFMNLVEFYVAICGDRNLLDRFPKLKALIGRVQSQPAIAAWINERPKSRL